MAGGAMAVAVILIFGCNLSADIRRIRTARMETAALGGIRRRGNVALQYNTVHFYLGIGMRDCRKKCLCIGVKRICKYILFASEFDHRAEIHNADFIGNELNHLKIVRDENVGKV